MAGSSGDKKPPRPYAKAQQLIRGSQRAEMNILGSQSPPKLNPVIEVWCCAGLIGNFEPPRFLGILK